MKRPLILGAAILVVGGLALAELARGPLDRLLWSSGLLLTGDVRAEHDIMLPMRDGVHLATDVYLPDGAPARKPALLVRLPYGKSIYEEVQYWTRAFTQRGYAVVVQDMRGRYGSEGIFTPYRHARSDGVDTLDWITAQSWSDGKVGTIGCSALGETQALLAAEKHPAHLAMIPIGAGGAAGTVGSTHAYFGAFEGGIFNLASAFGWFVQAGGKSADAMGYVDVDYGRAIAQLPVKGMVARHRSDPTDFDDFLTEFTNPAYWQQGGYISAEDRFETPALFVDTWYDPSISGMLSVAQSMRAGTDNVHVLIAPGMHCNYEGAFAAGGVGDVPVSRDGMLPFIETFAAFFDHHLRGAPAPDLPPYRYYVMVEDVWRDAEVWPPAGVVRTKFYLTGDQRLTADAGPAATVKLVSDPFDPVPTVGGAICCTGDPDLRVGPLFQNRIERREDVRLFTSAPMEEPTRIAGPLQATIHVSSDTPDADLVLRLTDVFPDGRSRMVQEGALRLRYRNGFETPELMEPGQVYQATVRMRDISYLLEPGHRLRLHIAGSSFPRLDRNLNTGGNNYDETEGQIATLTIHTGVDTPSVVTVPILPD